MAENGGICCGGLWRELRAPRRADLEECGRGGAGRCPWYRVQFKGHDCVARNHHGIGYIQVPHTPPCQGFQTGVRAVVCVSPTKESPSMPPVQALSISEEPLQGKLQRWVPQDA